MTTTTTTPGIYRAPCGCTYKTCTIHGLTAGFVIITCAAHFPALKVGERMTPRVKHLRRPVRVA